MAWLMITYLESEGREFHWDIQVAKHSGNLEQDQVRALPQFKKSNCFQHGQQKITIEQRDNN